MINRVLDIVFVQRGQQLLLGILLESLDDADDCTGGALDVLLIVCLSTAVGFLFEGARILSGRELATSDLLDKFLYVLVSGIISRFLLIIVLGLLNGLHWELASIGWVLIAIVVVVLLVLHHLFGACLRVNVLLWSFVLRRLFGLLWLVDLHIDVSRFLLMMFLLSHYFLHTTLIGRVTDSISVPLLDLLVAMVLFVRMMLHFDFLLACYLNLSRLFLLIVRVLLLSLSFDLGDLANANGVLGRLFGRCAACQLCHLEHLRVHVVRHLPHHERRHMEAAFLLYLYVHLVRRRFRASRDAAGNRRNDGLLLFNACSGDSRQQDNSCDLH